VESNGNSFGYGDEDRARKNTEPWIWRQQSPVQSS